MEKVQDIVIRYVNDYLSDRLNNLVEDDKIQDIKQDVEVKILSAFYERGITS